MFLVEDAEILKAEPGRGGFSTMLNVGLSVDRAFEAYRQAAREGGYDLLQTDNEGFEAEVYLTKGKRLAAISIRMSRCDDRSVVFINEIVPEK